MSEAPDWATVFDTVADEYGQSGVDFFGPIAAGLAEVLAASAGEQILEVGPGRGALTRLLAEAVGESGRVDAVDISPRMAALLTEEVAGLPQVRVAVGDALAAHEPSYDVVAASLVLFFVPDPAEALAHWRSLLRDSGRVGISTFQPWRAGWLQINDLLTSTSGSGPERGDSPFETDAGVEELFRSAGFSEVWTVSRTYDVVFDDTRQWYAHAMGSAYRAPLSQLDSAQMSGFLSEVGAILEASNQVLPVDIRYTLARP